MDMAIDPDPSAPTTVPPDAAIDQSAALTYWNSIPSTVNGMLGGFPHISRIDLQGSANFLSKLRRQTRSPAAASPLPRAADCGAGIGRVTHGFLRNVARTVDVVEPVRKFTERLVAEGTAVAGKGEVGEVWNLGLQDWMPEKGAYNLIWNQWCLGHLTDVQLVAYLRRCKEGLAVPLNAGDAEGAGSKESKEESKGESKEEGKAFAGAWIVVKENMSTDPRGWDIFDEKDSSVTRTDAKFRILFKEAGLRILATEVQKGFPKDLYPVRMYALRSE